MKTTREMKKLLLLSIFWIGITQLHAQDTEDKPKVNLLQASLAYPIGTAGIKSPDYSNRFSINMTYGVNGGVDGLELGGFANVNKGDVNGVQLSGALNINTSHSYGTLAAGFANITLHEAKGIQLSGFANYSGNTKGAMLSGFLNKSDNLDGAQVSGSLNIAENVDGIQLSGLMNIAKTVKGIQIAPILNVADTSDYCIALINLVKSGEKGLSLTVDEINTLMLSFRSGGRVMYGIVGAGYDLNDGEAPFALEAGLGAIVCRNKVVKLRVEGTSTSFLDGDEENYLRSSFRLIPTVMLGNAELIAGPSFNYIYSDRGTDVDLVDKYLWKNESGGDFNGIYLGFLAGINYRF